NMLDARVEGPACLGVDRVVQRLHAGLVEGVGVQRVLVRSQQVADLPGPMSHDFVDRAGKAMRNLLREQADLRTGFEADFPAFRLDLSSHQAQQGRLAGAVPTDQAGAIAPFELQGYAV